jgi:hypothetical protein
LIPLSTFNWITLSFYAAAILFGYLYAVMAWELNGPFSWMRLIDRPFGALSLLLKKTGKWRLKKGKEGKIIDFQTGEPLQNDEQFVDAMLEKISKQGEASLSWKERQRLQEISKRKQKR